MNDETPKTESPEMKKDWKPSEEYLARQEMRQEMRQKTEAAKAEKALGVPQVEIKSLVEQLSIRVWPDPVLRRAVTLIDEVTEWHMELAGRMAGMMKKGCKIPFGDQVLVIEPGIGLSAPQVGHSVSMLVVETGGQSEAAAIINPKIIFRSKKQVIMPEGCLSFPSFSARIKRPESVVVEAKTLGGEPVEIEADGIQARVLQHEIDHLNGVLFIDKIPPAGRSKLKRYLKNLRALSAARKLHEKDKAVAGG